MIMKMKEVLGRSDMSVEKGRELDEVFAPWVVGNKAKRLGPKQKDHLASQVDTSVENVQDYWLCYRRKYFKKVKRTVLFSIGILCEQNFLRQRGKTFPGKPAKTRYLIVSTGPSAMGRRYSTTTVTVPEIK